MSASEKRYFKKQTVSKFPRCSEIYSFVVRGTEVMEKSYKSTKIACYIGYMTQAIVINLAPIFFVIFSDAYGVDNARLGTLVLVNFLTQILTDLVSVKLVNKINTRLCAVAAHVFCFTGLMLLGALPLVFENTYAALMLSTVIYSVGGGLTEVILSPIIDAIPISESEGGRAKAAAMSFLHSFYCWGQVAVVLVSTLVLHFIGDKAWMLIPMLWALIPLVNTIKFLFVPIPAFVSERERTPVKRVVLSRLFVISAILMICSGASELAVSQWASMLAERGLGVSKVAGDILGPCAFALFMGTGRILYGIFGARLRLTRSLLFCSLLCTCGYLMIVLPKNPVIALVGCSVCGLSVSIMWPGVLSLTSREFPKSGAVLFSLLAVCGDIGCSLGPWLTGMVSNAVNTATLASTTVFSDLAPEQISLKCGLLAAGVFPIIMIFAVLAFMGIRRKNRLK